MLARFERLLESTVEGGLRRIFPAQLQPVQLAKAAARAMEEAQVIGFHGNEVPNAYTLRVAPADLERFASFRETLAREVRSYLDSYARDRGLRPVGPLQVQVMEDGSVPRGVVRADAHFVDLAPERQAELDEALSTTRALRFGDAAGPQASEQPIAGGTLVAATGDLYPLDPGQRLVRVGRSEDNDIVLGSARVSRYHAQLLWNGRGWSVQDLGSTNGTFVDDRRIDGPAELHPRSTLRLGDADFWYQGAEHAEGA